MDMGTRKEMEIKWIRVVDWAWLVGWLVVELKGLEGIGKEQEINFEINLKINLDRDKVLSCKVAPPPLPVAAAAGSRVWYAYAMSSIKVVSVSTDNNENTVAGGSVKASIGFDRSSSFTGSPIARNDPDSPTLDSSDSRYNVNLTTVVGLMSLIG
ncbi:hypothetical protein M0804_011092 [Polistes exclamans]|nr:hypothetical protein M0804_011092 [Polistes exclamans]